MRIGLISDTHNLLRPEAVDFLRGCEHIIHAGDICRLEVLEALRLLAPVTAVRGNNDRGAWAEQLREIELLQVGEVRICVIHDLSQLGGQLPEPGIKVVVSGHSHKPKLELRGDVQYVNPGSAGPRRFKLPISAGEITIENGSEVMIRTVDLPCPALQA